jgi:hypothetical protein
MRNLLLAGCLLAMTGCASSPMVWHKAGKTAEEIQSDWDACQRSYRSAVARENCMVGKGYRLVNRNSLPKLNPSKQD